MTRQRESHEYFRLLSAAAIDGEITPGELLELRAHLAGCSSCRADEQAMRRDNIWLATSEAARPPGARVREAVLEAAQGRRRRGGFARLAPASATVVVAVGALWWLGFGRQQLGPGASSPRPSAFATSAPGPRCAANPFTKVSAIPTTSGGGVPWALASADMNADGLTDLVILSVEPGTVGIMLGDGRGSFSQARPTTPADPNPLAGSGEPTLLAADVTNDGKLDVIATNAEQGKVVAFVGDGAGGLGDALIVDVGGQLGRLAVGQFSGDAIRDLAVADEGGAVRILVGDGTGAFVSSPPIELGGSPRGIAAGDLNGDGLADLVVGHDRDHRVDVLGGNGDGTFDEPLALDGLAATHVNLVDIDDDGDLDVILANSGPDSVSIMLNDGAGSFGLALVLPLANGAPGSTEAIDLDEDGHLDIVANDGVSNDLAIFIGDGRGAFRLLERMPAADGPTGLVAGDFDRDGRPDVATSNANGNSVSVFLNRCGTAPG